jgi:6-phosphogluconolactonase
VVACDLGIDEVKVYRFEKEGGTLTEAGAAKVAPGAGPRHVAFSGEGKFMYVINEMACTVTAFAYDGETGKATEVQTVGTLPAGHEQTDKDTGSEIFVHPTGRWVYASNRGHDSIVRFAVDGTSGKLSEPKWVASGGKIPRYFGIDPAGKWMLVANQGTGNVLTFKIDPQSGELAATGDGVEVGGATCVKFLVGE